MWGPRAPKGLADAAKEEGRVRFAEARPSESLRQHNQLSMSVVGRESSSGAWRTPKHFSPMPFEKRRVRTGLAALRTSDKRAGESNYKLFDLA